MHSVRAPGPLKTRKLSALGVRTLCIAKSDETGRATTLHVQDGGRLKSVVPFAVNVVSNVRPLLFASLVALASIAFPAIARADCSAAPLGSADDMVISFLAAQGGTQAAPSTQFASAVKEGMVVYDDTTNAIRYCDGTNWVTLVGSGGGAGATAAGAGSEVQFRNSSTGAFNADSAFRYDATNHRLTISSNAAPLDVGPFTNTVLHLSNIDGTSPRLLLDQFGGGSSTASNVTLRAAGGTGASPAGLADEDILGQLTFTGYDGTAYVSARAAVRGTATEAWSASATGADLRFHTTPNGTSNAIETMRLSHDGALSLGSGTDAAASALLDLASTTKGFLPPRMTEAQRDAIASPATGLVIYNTDTDALNYYDGDSWEAVGSGTGASVLNSTVLSSGTFPQSNGSTIVSAGSFYNLGSMNVEKGVYIWTVYNCAGQLSYSSGAGNNITISGTPVIMTTSTWRRLDTNPEGSCGHIYTGVFKTNASGTVSVRVASGDNSVLVKNGATAFNVDAVKISNGDGGGFGGGGGSSQWADVTGGLSYAAGGAAVGAAALNASAILQADSTTRGFLPPRMTTTQRDAIASPAEGLVVYNTTTKSLDLRVASSWLSFGGGMTGNTMVSGWPDAIRCNVTNPNWGWRTLYLQESPYASDSVYRYREPSTTNVVAFNSDGTYNSSVSSGYTTSNCNVSISSLYANNRAFNFVGGATASADGSAGQVQFNEGGNLKADAALHWDNTNKRLGIGTATPTVNLDVLGGTDAVYLRVRGPTHNVQLGEIGSGGELKTVTNGSLIFGTNNTTRMTIDATGNVGIGTTSPGSALDVRGTIRLTGATSGYVGLAPAAAAGSTTYTLPSADGSNGQVLSTNGSGTLSWITPASNYFWAAASHLTYASATGSCPSGSRAIQVPQSRFGQTGTQICAADSATDGPRTVCNSVRYWYIRGQGDSGTYAPSNLSCSAAVPIAWPWAKQGPANSRPDEWVHSTYVVCCQP